MKPLLLGLMLAYGVVCHCQSNGGALVDKRVTLDDNNADKDNRAKQQQSNVPKHQQQQPNQAFTQPDEAPHIELPSSAGNAVVSASVDSATIIVGEQKMLNITVHRKSKAKPLGSVRFPSLQELNKGPIEALESTTDTLFADNGEVESITQQVTITSFDQGRHLIDHIIVGIADGGRLDSIAPAEELWLNVAYSADADTTTCTLMPDAQQVKEPYTFWEIARWVLLVILLAAAAFAVVWVMKRRKENKPIVILPKAKPVPADKKALAEIESIRRKELWQKGRIKKYYTDLTDVVRRFLYNMYGLSANEMTTRQTLRAFRNLEDWSEESNELLRQLLQKADMVKFAKSEPEAHEHDLSMQNAIDFVRKVAETHRLNNPEKEGEQ